jgi:catechol 2,3-dioxygenase-like lactoylglutathione lyase family enzyme
MTGDIDILHHVGLVVADLEPAVSVYETLGFSFTPLSMHKGSRNPGEPETPFGTGNRCAIFGRNFLEIVAHVVPDRWDFGITRFLERYEGLHIICFGADDAAVVDERLTKAGIGTSGVIPLQRDVETQDGIRAAQMACVHFKTDTPEGLVQAAQHLTPQYILQPRHMDHPNGAVMLTNVILCVEDPDEYEAKYARLTGRPASRQGQARVIELPTSRVMIVPPEHLGDLLPGAVPPVLPFMAGFAVSCKDLDVVRALLDQGEVPSESIDGKIVVPARAGCGTAVLFEALR